MADRFDEIYAQNIWGHGSGEGSLPQYTRGYCAFLQQFLAGRGVRSVVDMGCGDWQFSREIDWGRATYSGYDVAESVVEANRRSFARPGISFHHYSGDPGELPAADLLIVKDVLQHLPNAAVLAFLPNLGRYRYALLTNCVSPRGVTPNRDIALGDFRPIDLRLAPFNLRAPEVYRFSKPMGPLRRLLRRPEWTKSVLLVERG